MGVSVGIWVCIYKYEYECEYETWGAGVVFVTVDTHSSLFQFRTHFLVRLVPINYRYHGPIKRFLTICNTETLYQQYSNRHLGLMRFLVFVFFHSGTKFFLLSWVSTPAPYVSWVYADVQVWVWVYECGRECKSECAYEYMSESTWVCMNEYVYEVATISRLPKNTRLFCKRTL